eukprot:SAG11_NODE_694_length_7695_cov_2.772775_2_plen_163_part_00
MRVRSVTVPLRRARGSALWSGGGLRAGPWLCTQVRLQPTAKQVALSGTQRPRHLMLSSTIHAPTDAAPTRDKSSEGLAAAGHWTVGDRASRQKCDPYELGGKPMPSDLVLTYALRDLPLWSADEDCLSLSRSWRIGNVVAATDALMRLALLGREGAPAHCIP